MKKLGILKKIAVSTLLLFILLIVILQAVLSGKVNSIIIAELEKQTGSKITLEKCKVSLFPSAGIHIKGLKIGAPKGEWNEAPIVNLGDVRIKVATLPLLTGTIDVKSFVIKESDLLYEVNKQGESNVDALLQAKEKKEPKDKKKKHWKIKIKKNYTIDGLRLRYVNHHTGEKYECNNISQRLTLDLNTKSGDVITKGKISASDIIIKPTGQPILLNGVSLSFVHDLTGNINTNNYTINTISTSFNNLALTLSGVIADTTIDLSIKTKKLKFSDILKEIPTSLSPELAKLSCKGSIQLNIDVKGPMNKPAIDGTFDIDKGTFKYSDLPESIHSVFAKAHFTENSLTLKKLALKIGNDPIDIKATIKNFTQPTIDAKVKANLNLDNLKKSITLPKGHAINGHITSDLAIKGTYSPTNPTALAVSGGMTFKNFSIITPDVAQTIRMNGSITLSPRKIIQNMHLVLGTSDCTYKGNIENWQTLVFSNNKRKGLKPKLRFTLSSQFLDIDKLLPQKKATTTSKAVAKAEKSPKETTVISPILTTPLPNIDIALTINAQQIRYDGLTLRSLYSKTSINNDKAVFSLNFNLFGGRVTSNQTLLAKDLENLRFASTFNVTNINGNQLINHYNDKLVDTKPLFVLIKNFDNGIHGTLNLRTKFKTHGYTNADFQENIAGTINASFKNGHFIGGTLTRSLNEKMSKFLTFDTVRFRDLETSLRINKERVYIDTLSINAKRAGDWKTYGSIGFDATLDLKLENRLPLKISEKLTGATDKVKSEVTKGIKDKLGGTLGGFAAGVIDKQGIPSDAEGRVTLLLAVKGVATSPDVKTLGFKKGTTKKSVSTKETLKSELEKEFKKQFDKKKEKLQAEAEKEIKKQTDKAVKEVEKKLKGKVTEEQKRKFRKKKKEAGKKFRKNVKKFL